MISVIIAYKEPRFLDDAIQSVENQTFKDWELILEQGDNLRGVNVNNALNRSKGEYIKLLDDDDMLPSNSLKDLHEGIQGVDFVYGNARSFGIAQEIYVGKQTDLKECLAFNKIHGGTTLYHRRCFEETGGFDETLWTCEEYDFHLMLMEKGFTHKYINSFVHLYRVHFEGKSLVYRMTRREERDKLREEIQRRYLD